VARAQPKVFLVIEDNAYDAALIRLAFNSLGSCTASVCRNLSEAKAYMRGSGMYSDRSMHPFPNAVICELNLEGESGVEFVIWLTASADFRRLPVVILTGSTSQADILAARERGAVSILTKPARFEELRAMLMDLTLSLWPNPLFDGSLAMRALTGTTESATRPNRLK
jgi:CheY-like chemotaxis protein